MNGGDTDAGADAGQAAGSGGRERLWDSPGYAAWFTSDTAAAAGMAMRSLAVSMVGYAVSGSTVWAGWLGTASMVVQQTASLFGGVFVDRHDRRRLIMANAIAGTVAWGMVAALLAAGILSFPVLMVVAVLASGVNGFLGSATDAMLRSIIDVGAYPKARSLNEGRDATISMLGGPAGGFLYGVSPWLPFLASSLLYALSGAAASNIGTSLPPDTPGGEDHGSRGSFMHDLKEGWSWSSGKPTIVSILAAASLLNFGVNGIQYAIQLHLVAEGVNATSIGLVSAGISLAMLAGSLIAGRLAGRLHAGAAACLSFAFVFACAVAVAWSDGYWTMLAANSLIGLPFPIINAMLMGFIFAKSPACMQGRISVTLTVPAQVLSMFCSATAGMLLPALGFHGTACVFVSVLAAGAAVALGSPSIRHIPRASQWEHAAL